MVFDPNAPALAGSGVFGLSHGENDALVILLPVPWEATTSYGGGASDGPRAILEASAQVDLYDLDVDRPYLAGIHMLAESEEIIAKNGQAKSLARKVIEAGGVGRVVPRDAELEGALARVNALSDEVNQWVEAEVVRLLDAGKIVGVVGGDHSVPFGALCAVAARTSQFGVLHIDAHADTRDAYEGFEHSHASIMRNVLLRIPEVGKLVQIGIRDVCEQEVHFGAQMGSRIRTFTDRDIARQKHDGVPFSTLAREVVSALPPLVWVSFDIDGLDPRYCPHTGTPVPGGLDIHEVFAIVREAVRSDRQILGFDLCEVAPNPFQPEDEWDGNVGARVLYKLIAFTLASQGKSKLFD
ncbi:MAG: agmatinase family protein [Polyangiaceae bacterium]|nr:agmatinase family protein [Polyangiaceae bacterium]